MEPSTDAVGDKPSSDIGGTREYQPKRNLLTPADVRWQEFPLTRFGRRGFDPEAVRRFLRRLEADLDALYRELVAAQDEARRHQAAAAELRAQRWRPDPSARRPRNEYRRPPLWPPYSPRRQGCQRRPGEGPGDD
ncbi:DivIVA domain-containing protein [Micromonospora carbonacea]|uniref:DivIVA domain-containing protein n=1 Tax=Micromonospora carbonacea TaxID=47853 RepID=UPI0033F9169F